MKKSGSGHILIQILNFTERQKLTLHDKNNTGLAMENVQKHRNAKFVNNYKIRNCLISERNYYLTKWFPKYVEMVFDISAFVDTERPLLMGKKKKSHMFYEKWIRCRNNEGIFTFKTKNVP